MARYFNNWNKRHSGLEITHPSDPLGNHGSDKVDVQSTPDKHLAYPNDPLLGQKCSGEETVNDGGKEALIGDGSVIENGQTWSKHRMSRAVVVTEEMAPN